MFQGLDSGQAAHVDVFLLREQQKSVSFSCHLQNLLEVVGEVKSLIKPLAVEEFLALGFKLLGIFLI